MVWQVISLAALVIGVTALALAVRLRVRTGTKNRSARPPSPTPVPTLRVFSRHGTSPIRQPPLGRDHVAFIVNPTKPGLARLEEAAYRASRERHLPEPMWFPTTPDDPGTDAARRAITAGADVLVAAGGDGTARAVAAAAADSGLPMGVIPLGTGNLLARNLHLPLKNVPAALAVALDGEEYPIDIGWVLITNAGVARELPFLVIAGIGFDAEMVAGAKPSWKSRIGWLAYGVSGLRHLRSSRMRASIEIDDQPPVEKKMRTILVANCGRLPAGLVLVPDARIDDGRLDVAILDARGGIAGWTELAGRVWLQGTRINAPALPDSWRVGRIDHSRGSSVSIQTESPQRTQIDGEPVGYASSLQAWVEPGAVRIRSQGPIRDGNAPAGKTGPKVDRRRSV